MSTEKRSENNKTTRNLSTVYTKRLVQEIVQLRLSGSQFQEIAACLARKGWAVTKRQLRAYIQLANKRTAAEVTGSIKHVIALHFDRLEDRYREALKSGDLRAALAALQENAKLRSLYPDKNLKELMRVSKEQDQRIAELERCPREGGTVPHAAGTR